MSRESNPQSNTPLAQLARMALLLLGLLGCGALALCLTPAPGLATRWVMSRLLYNWAKKSETG